eukprot:Tamp_15320.p1 GENE.Tamp_15320~~Tamp_15320.p1  ORF type:complete len:258 (+),score=28.20 Tamp_15320:506-1279(+)
MGGSALVFEQFHDDAFEGVYISFTEMDMVALQRLVRLRLHSLSYPQIDLLLYRLFDVPLVDAARNKYAWVRERFRNASVAVLGSTQPWFEAMALTEGARRVVTIEHNVVDYRHPALHAYTHAAFFAAATIESPETFDVMLSLSSFEHDGLGRYGDALDPDGDLRSMTEAARILRPGGVMILAVPIAKDAVVWNAHRVYGRARLRLLLRGWKVECTLGLDPQILDQPLANPSQPLLILTRCKADEDGDLCSRLGEHLL